MKFSAWPNQPGEWRTLRDFAGHIEQSGWDGLWIADHFIPNQEDNSGPVGEAWTTIGALAAVVPRIRLGTMVAGNTYRHPAVLAKMAAQVDEISGGRLVFGIGAAWQQNEHEAYGIPLHTVGGRLRRLEEAVQIICSLFENEQTDFAGKFYQITNAPLSPKPVQRPRPPLLIGGGGEKSPFASPPSTPMSGTSGVPRMSSVTRSAFSNSIALTSVATRPRFTSPPISSSRSQTTQPKQKKPARPTAPA
jgi:alkanesulfonate monooxygenase SsuD/methylene tetrahydromethanopterin reductase-like flavin-dependent oxidoreductase (luciferase family)